MFTGSAPTPPSTVVECWLQRLEKATRLLAKDGYRVVGYATLTEDEGNEFTVPVAPGPYAAQYRFVNRLTGQATPLVSIPVSIPVSGVALSLEAGGADEAETGMRKAA